MNDQKDEPAFVYEQLAEEATELAHAALKYARILRNENPTPILKADGYNHMVEEFTDVTLCAKLLQLQPDEDLMELKQRRWISRLWARR